MIKFGLVLVAASMAVTAFGSTASAQDRYLAEVVATANNFCPRGTLPADGQLLPIPQYTAVFSLMGTTYGGDGRTTFALPNLKSRTPMGQGRGPGLQSKRLGQRGGQETVQLNLQTMPSHRHDEIASTSQGDTNVPSGAIRATSTPPQLAYATTNTADVPMSPNAVGSTGGDVPFSVVNPYTTITYCIVMEGIYPPRS